MPFKPFDERFEVSNLGRFRSLYIGCRKRRTPHIYKSIGKSRQGYPRVNLRCPGVNPKSGFIHRMVLIAFQGEPPTPGHVCAHLDGTTDNNNIENLQWTTQRENCSHKVLHGTNISGERHSRHKLTKRQVDEIRDIWSKRLLSQSAMARLLGVSQASIHKIVSGENWAERPLFSQ